MVFAWTTIPIKHTPLNIVAGNRHYVPVYDVCFALLCRSSLLPVVSYAYDLEKLSG